MSANTLRIKAFMAGTHQARLQQAYLEAGSLVHLAGVPCEMTFHSDAAWLDHEDEQHHYLPVFHIRGNVSEIHGNFPYNVTSLVFDEETTKVLKKDILYFMTPKEMAHIIETGKFYSDKFEIPEVLKNNEYSFPVVTNLYIVPPERPQDPIEKDNVPIFYVEFAGTGVTRKNDKLLDYYGIDFDIDYPVYAMTAESSGYTDPTLMEYIVAPVEEAEEQAQQVDESEYLTKEDEQNLIRTKQQEKEEEQKIDLQENYQPTEEDLILANADKRIEERMARQMKERGMTHISKVPVNKAPETTATDALSALSGKTESGKTESSKTGEKEQPSMNLGGEFAAEKTAGEKDKLAQPDAPQQMKEVKMDLNPYENETVKEERKEEKTENAGLAADETDEQKLAMANGADVSDARLQTKVDEANAKKDAAATAVDVQKDVQETSEKKPEAEKKTHREVSERLQDVADAADAQQAENEDQTSL